jgi:hypothetical protein
LMPEAPTTFIVMVEGHMMNLEWMAQLGHLKLMNRGGIHNMDIALQQIKTMGKLWKSC